MIEFAARAVCVLVLAFSGLAPVSAIAGERDDLYCAERGLGHWFYCTRPEPEAEVEEQAEAAPPARPMSEEEALLAEAEAFQRRLDELRLLAAYAPTEERVRTYQAMQWRAMEGAALFSDYWRRNVWSDPALDYSVRRPVAQYARSEWIDQRSMEMTADLAGLSERYGLFYFYRSDCPYCARFSPVLRYFADSHGVEVRAVSVDGGPSPEFPDARLDTGQFELLLGGREAVVPAVMLLNTETNTTHWVSFGAISGQELAQRIFVTMSREPGEDY